MDGIAEKKGDSLFFTDNTPLKQVTSKIKAFLDYNLLGRNQWGGAFWLLFFCCFGCWWIFLLLVCLGFLKYCPQKLSRHYTICF